MKRREDEILEIINDNPLISQKEIADILDITRSSVGVHINNLTKKGKIIGRGYVLSKVDKICVIGGANLDFVGSPIGKLYEGSSSIGEINIQIGGSARNIAENIVKLGVHAELITALGKDTNGKIIQDHCIKVGIRLDKSSIFEGESTSQYLSVMNEEGKLKHGISDMSVIDEITPAIITQKKADINNSELIVLDANLPQETIEFIVINFKKKKILIDTVSIKKVEKIKNVISGFYLLNPSIQELEVLTDMEISSEEDMIKAANMLIKQGVNKVVIFCKGNGTYCFDKNGYFIDKPNLTTVKNENGVREAFLATISYGLYHDLEMEEIIKLANEAANMTFESEQNVSPWINANELRMRTGKDE